MKTIIGLSGSLRAGAFNTALLRAAAGLMPDGPKLLVKTIHGIPLYDVGVVGYPQRMREWTAKRKANGELGPPGAGGPSV